MSANVWFEEVDRGLLNEIRNTVKIRDMHGVLIPLEDNQLIVRKPEEDFKIEQYPCVSIYNLSEKFDPRRYNSRSVVVSRDYETKQATLEEPAVPFNLLYQIDFWAEYQEDMNFMTRQWLMKHFRQFNLDVVDDGGVKRSCNCIKNENPKKSDLILNKERLFHTIFSYYIWVELDDEIRYNKPMVTDINIKSNIRR